MKRNVKQQRKTVSDKATSILAPVLSNRRSEPTDVQKGKELFEKIVVDLDTYYLFCPYKVGDTILVIGYADAARINRHCNKVKLILKKSQELFGIFYSHIYDYTAIREIEMFQLSCYFVENQLFYGTNWNYAHFPISRDWNWTTVVTDPSKNWIDNWKMNCLGLQKDAKHQKMQIDVPNSLKAALTKKYKLSREKTIILTPNSYSMVHLDINFWEYLAQNLTELGYFVYTNVGYAHEEPIKGTMPLFADFRELYFISRNVKAFISSRSGINDFLIFHSAPMIILYSNLSIKPEKDLNATAIEAEVPVNSVYISLENMESAWLLQTILSLVRNFF